MPWILTVSPRSLDRGRGRGHGARDGRAIGPFDRGRRGVPRAAARRRRPDRPAGADGDRWPARWSPRTTCTPGSRSRSTRRPRRSSSPGGRCSSSITPTSPATTRSRSSGPSGSTSPTTGSATRRCGPAMTASGWASAARRRARATGTGVRHGRPPRAWPPQPRGDRAARRPPVHAPGPRPRRPRGAPGAVPRPRRAPHPRTSSTGSPPPSRRRSPSSRPSAASSRPRRRPRSRTSRLAAGRARAAASAGREIGLREGLLGVAAELVLVAVPRRHARRAVPRPRARPAAARVGGLDRPAALRAERRGGGRRSATACGSMTPRRGGGVRARVAGDPGRRPPLAAGPRSRRGRGAADLRAAGFARRRRGAAGGRALAPRRDPGPAPAGAHGPRGGAAPRVPGRDLSLLWSPRLRPSVGAPAPDANRDAPGVRRAR